MSTDNGLTARIGGVVFKCEPRGTHYHVTVRGHGPEGHRPLLGKLTCLPGEWHDLTDAEDKSVAVLLPVENIALTVARGQVKRGDNPPPNTTAMLVMALDRLTGRADWTKERNHVS